MADNMVYGRVLYDNAFLDDGSSIDLVTITEIAGFPKEYALDWMDWTSFRLKTVTGSGNTQGIIRVGGLAASRPFNSIAWFIRDPGNIAGAGTHMLKLYTWDAIGDYVAVTGGDVDLYTDGLIGIKSFANATVPSGHKLALRFKHTGADFTTYPWDVRQFAVGENLTFPIGQRGGIKPPRWQRQFRASNAIAVAGSILGRDVIRENKAGVIDLQPVDEDFVEDDWVPFMEHATRFPFFYQWDYANKPLDAVFAAAEALPPPENIAPPPFMGVQMPWVGLNQ